MTNSTDNVSSDAPRICMIVLSRYPNDVRVRREAEALERAGIGVDIICQQGAGEASEESIGLVKVYRVHKVGPKESIGRYVAHSLAFTWAAFRKLQKLSRERPYKVIQVHNMPDYLVFAAAFQKWKGSALVLDLHDLMVELFEGKWGKKKNALLGPIVKLVEGICCRFADRLITTSIGFEESLIRRGIEKEKITMVLNTADPAIFRADIERTFEPIQSGARILYHGTVAARFGLTKAIEAMPHFLREIPESQFRIFGKYDASYESELKQLIANLGLEKNVKLEGWRSLEQIAEIISESDVGIVPYLSDPFMNLALSTKTFEYAQMGLPVVASRLPSITSIFDEDAIMFFEAGNEVNMAQKMSSLCRDPQRRKVQSQLSLAALEPISGTIMAQRYTNLMKQLLESD